VVKEHTAGLSDDAMQSATGRHPAEWFALLDEAGAAGWGHTAIARWLVAEHGVARWWNQNITVRYEQARGLRLPGQQSDGTFSVSTSKTVAGSLDAAYERMVAAFSAALGGNPDSARAEGKRPYARWKATAGSVLVTAEAAGAKIRLSAVHERLTGPEEMDSAKDALVGVLAGLAS